MAKPGRPRKTRRSRAAKRVKKSFAKRRAQARAKGFKPMGNTSTKGVLKGVGALGVVNHFARPYMGRVPAQYRLPVKMWAAGIGSDYVFNGGNADLKSAGLKLASLAFIQTTLPALAGGMGLANGNGSRRNGNGVTYS